MQRGGNGIAAQWLTGPSALLAGGMMVGSERVGEAGAQSSDSQLVGNNNGDRSWWLQFFSPSQLRYIIAYPAGVISLKLDLYLNVLSLRRS